MPFLIDRRAEASTIRITVHGELDLATAPDLRTAIDDAIAERGAERIVVDLSDMTFCDSSGIRILLRAMRVSQLHQVDLTMVPAAPSVQRIFLLAGLDEALPFSRP